MFWHNFKYSLKTLFANKMLIFWTFIFPIVLGLFFYLAFSNIEDSEKLEVIDIAVIENENLKNNEMFKTTLDELSKKSDKQIFNTKYTTLEEAEKLLENDKISGYVILEKKETRIIVSSSGINETIIKYVIDEINSNIDMVDKLASKEMLDDVQNNRLKMNYQEIYAKAAQMVTENTINIKDTSSSNLSYTMIEYYTLIAMSCLYGGMLSLYIVNLRLANMSDAGKRTSIVGVSKTKLILSSLLASYIVELLGVLLLFLFTIFVINVNYGNNLPLIVLLAIVGSFAGLSIGVCIASVIKSHENAKIGILIGVVMLFSYLSGMMGITLKYAIDKNVPILGMINPANMITDGLYSLYYYETLSRYFYNLLGLVIFSVVMLLISLGSLRRQKYDSI